MQAVPTQAASQPDSWREMTLQHTSTRLIPPAERRLSFLDSLAGRVFQLTLEDARAITASSHVIGGIWLTDPYSGTLPFITISISQEACGEYTIGRPQAL